VIVVNPIRIALTKGRLEKRALSLFQTIGLDCSQLLDKGRRLILPLPPYEAVLAKAADVLTYVEHGACDLGLVGKDTIVERGGAGFYEMADLGFGQCRFALAALRGANFFGGHREKIVATKYPNVTQRFFAGKGMDVRVIKIEGSVELAPLLCLADGIVDIVETGNTLRENGLEVVEEIAPVSARLVVNMASLKLRKEEIEALLRDVELAKIVA
jgi:ATP phosphoribosyltransferase